MIKLARQVAGGMPLLDPRFSTLLAQGVMARAASMPEREVVSALNICTTMAAKSKLMQGKGLTKDIDPLSEIREWFRSSVLVEAPGEGDNTAATREEVDDDEQEDGLREAEGDTTVQRDIPEGETGDGL